MNRPRGKGSRDLPSNLYADRRIKAVYYVYRHPINGTRHGMGSDRTQAILAARQLNSMLCMEASLVDQVLGATQTMASWVEKYEAARLAETNMADKTAKQLNYDLRTISKHLGAIPVADLSVHHCAQFLDIWVTEGKRRMGARMRSQLIKCLDYAMAAGLADSNPASRTLAIDAKVHRKRLTRAQFDAILINAKPHIQNAMMLGLVTLQRREDIATMRFKDARDGHLYVAQQKTGRAKKARRADALNQAAHLMIEVTPQLAEIISNCRKTGVVSQYLIHHLHGRKSSGATHREVKPGMPLQPDNITRGFKTARDKTGLFDDMQPKERPTFHEIRALGAHLYQEQGIDPQGLLGHTDAEMTRHYLDGHGTEWTVVSAGLAL